MTDDIKLKKACLSLAYAQIMLFKLGYCDLRNTSVVELAVREETRARLEAKQTGAYNAIAEIKSRMAEAHREYLS